jgi:RNA polymerase sigma factor for flagellar operon FliA
MSHDRDSLILEHLKLAETIATREWRTAVHALKKDDMLSLAYWGLLDAAEKWPAYCEKNESDPDATQYFKVYASLRIRGAIRDHIRSEDWATRTTRSKSKKLKDAGQDDGASVEELSERTGMTVLEINKVITKLAYRPVSLDAYTSNNDTYQESPGRRGNSELRDDIDTESSAFANDMRSIFVTNYRILNREIQIVLALHYYSRMDLRTIAAELGLSESKVSQIHANGVKYLRTALVEAATESEVYA